MYTLCPQLLKRWADPQLARALGFGPSSGPAQWAQDYRAAAGSVAGGDVVTLSGDKFVEESRCPVSVATATGPAYGSMRLTQNLAASPTTCK